MVYRDDFYKDLGAGKDGKAEIVITKNRNGATGTVELEWNGMNRVYVLKIPKKTKAINFALVFFNIERCCVTKFYQLFIQSGTRKANKHLPYYQKLVVRKFLKHLIYF